MTSLFNSKLNISPDIWSDGRDALCLLEKVTKHNLTSLFPLSSPPSLSSISSLSSSDLSPLASVDLYLDLVMTLAYCLCLLNVNGVTEELSRMIITILRLAVSLCNSSTMQTCNATLEEASQIIDRVFFKIPLIYLCAENIWFLGFFRYFISSAKCCKESA